MKYVVACASFALLLQLAPVPVYAATTGLFGPTNPIVPAECSCEKQKAPDGKSLITTAPAYGCVLQTLQNVVNDGISIAIVICVLWLALAGALFLMSAGNPGMREQGKTRIMNAVIGLVVILAAWLIVDFVMKTLYNEKSDFGPWNSILASKSDTDKCVVATNPTSIASGTLSILQSVTPGTSSGPAAGGGVGSSGLNIAAATHYATIHYPNTTSDKHACLAGVQLALHEGGKTLACPPDGYADQCDAPLLRLGFASLGSSDPSPLAGDIVVIQPFPGEKGIGGKAGHIAMYSGTAWISDFTQIDFWGGPGYRANQPAHTFYRP
ncbi:MAG: pilin [Patescibacteria group bacterium]